MLDNRPKRHLLTPDRTARYAVKQSTIICLWQITFRGTRITVTQAILTIGERLLNSIYDNRRGGT
jgi:hypothetical protein